MTFWRSILSKVAGAIPSVSQMTPETFSWNVRDGKAHGLKIDANGNKSVVPIGGDSEPGLDGEDAFVYIAYASDINGTGFTLINNPAHGYMAVLNTNTAIADPAVENFEGLWYKRLGADGLPGDPTEVFVEPHPQFSFDYLKYTRAGVTETITVIDKLHGLEEGGNVSLLELLQFIVSAAFYFFFGAPKSTDTTIIELDAADPDLPRIDIICIDINEQVLVVTGVPAENPQKPLPDPMTQIELTQVLVPAGAVTPGGISTELIYDENVEWAGVGSGVVVDFDSAVLPFHGVKCADISAIGNNDTIVFTRGAGAIDITSFANFSMNIKFKAAVTKQYNLSIQLLLNTIAVSREVLLTFDGALTTWQNINSAFSAFGITTKTINGIRLKWIKTGAAVDHAGFYLDFLKFEGGISTPAPNDYKGWNFDALTESGIIRTLIQSGQNAFFQAKAGSRIRLGRFSHMTNGNVLEIDFDETGIGASAYIYVAYASDINGTGFTLVNDPAFAYTAVLATDTEIPIPAVEDFVGLWYNRKGINGVTPHIGANLHWWIGEIDTGIVAEGQDGQNGNTPYIGGNFNWWIAGVDTGILAQGSDGVGVPPGGTTGQIIRKQSATDYDNAYVDDIDDRSFEYRDITNVEMTYILDPKASFNYAILGVVLECTGATSVDGIAIKIEGVNVGGLSALTATTLQAEIAATSVNSVVAGNRVTLTATGITGTPTALVGKIIIIKM